MNDDEKRARVAEIRERWIGENPQRRGGGSVVWLCAELISALDESKAARAVADECVRAHWCPVCGSDTETEEHGTIRREPCPVATYARAGGG